MPAPELSAEQVAVGCNGHLIRIGTEVIEAKTTLDLRWRVTGMTPDAYGMVLQVEPLTDDARAVVADDEQWQVATRVNVRSCYPVGTEYAVIQ